jgi:hypothetical protein
MIVFEGIEFLALSRLGSGWPGPAPSPDFCTNGSRSLVAAVGCWFRVARVAASAGRQRCLRRSRERHTLAEQLVAERQQLESANARHEQWVAGSSLRGDAAHGTWPGAGRPLAGRDFDAADARSSPSSATDADLKRWDGAGRRLTRLLGRATAPASSQGVQRSGRSPEYPLKDGRSVPSPPWT